MTFVTLTLIVKIWLVWFEGELEIEVFWDVTLLLVVRFLTFDDHSAFILKGFSWAAWQ